VAATNDNGFKVEAQGEVEIIVTRMFNAPARLVFQAHTSCEHLKKWFSPTGSDLQVCEVDFRVGGAFRFGWSGFELTGEYKEIVPPSKIVRVENAGGGYQAEGTVTLDEQDGRTKFTQVTRYPNQQMRDWLLNSGMREGLGSCFEHLDEFLALQKQ
jgi:uncharacterized protein YndB with AHSA1/START domain